jgi:hypothetical protein
VIPRHAVRGLGVADEGGDLGEVCGSRPDVGTAGEALEQGGRILAEAGSGQVDGLGQRRREARVGGRSGRRGRRKRIGSRDGEGELLEAGRREERVPASRDLGDGGTVGRGRLPGSGSMRPSQ